MRPPTTTALAIAMVTMATHVRAEPVAVVAGQVVDQREIDAAFGPDATARDDLRSLAVASLAVARSVGASSGEPGGVGDLRVRDAVAFLEGLDAEATKGAKERLKDGDYRSEYEARGLAGDGPPKVPWVAVGPEDKAAFEAAYAARMGFRMACGAITAALATVPVKWLVAEPKSWKGTFSNPSNCANR